MNCEFLLKFWWIVNCELCWYCEDTTSTTILTRVEKLKEKFSNFVVNRFFSIYFSRQIFKLSKPGGGGGGCPASYRVSHGGGCPATRCPLRGLSSYSVAHRGTCPAAGCSTRALSSYRVFHWGVCPATGCPTEGLVQLQGVPLRGFSSYRGYY